MPTQFTVFTRVCFWLEKRSPMKALNISVITILIGKTCFDQWLLDEQNINSILRQHFRQIRTPPEEISGQRNLVPRPQHTFASDAGAARLDHPDASSSLQR